MDFFRSAFSRMSRILYGACGFLTAIFILLYNSLSRVTGSATGIALGCVGGAWLLLYFFVPLTVPLDAASHLPGWNPAKSQVITISSLSGIVTAQPVLDKEDGRWKLIPNGPVLGNYKVKSFADSITGKKIFESKDSRGQKKENLQEKAVKPRASFSMDTFEKLLHVPSKKLHPELSDLSGPVLVVFTWEDCPTCSALQRYFDTYKKKYPFQILFAPIGGLAGNNKLDASALRFLDKQTAPKKEQEDLLSGVRVTSQILADHTGGLRVPAFAWRVGDGELPGSVDVGCANLSGRELDQLLAKMAAVDGQRSSK